MIKVFYDLETTGTDVKKHSVHQIAGLVEVNGEVVESFNLHTQPHPKCLYEPMALKVCGKTQEELMAYPPMGEIHQQFTKMLEKYINKFDQTDMAWLVGFNNRAFDDIFLHAWFEQNGDKFLGSWFWPDTLDALVLASQYLIERRPSMPSFKLKRVALELGLVVDKDKLHDALYDVGLTREIYRIVTGLEYEL